MKLTRILAVATLMAAMCAAQSTGSGSQQPAGAGPSPTPALSPAKAGTVATKPSAAGTKKKTASSTTRVNATKKPAASAKTQTSTATTPSAARKIAAATTTQSTGSSAAKGSSAATGKTATVTKTRSTPSKGTATGVKGAATSSKGAAAGNGPSLGTTVSPVKGGAAGGSIPTVKSGAVLPSSKTSSKTAKASAKSTAEPAKKAAVGAVLRTKPPAAASPVVAAAASVAPEVKARPRPAGAAGRRDPFVSVIRKDVGPGGPGANCTTGKRCLSIPELVLQGTVRDISGKMMAVVVNSTRHTYTLRENDQVFNGSVEKITTDSIIFREFVKDVLGRESAREIVKKVGPT